MKHNTNSRTNGNAAIAVILLLLIAGAAAWWFLFRTPAGTIQPGASRMPEAQAGSSSSTATDNSSQDIAAIPSAGSAASSSSSLSSTDPANIDWDARRAELKQQYADEFVEPVIGTKTKILLASGTAVEGTINDLSKDTVTLRIVGTGKATYNRGQISPQSQLLIFRDVFAEYSAQKKIADEKAKTQPAAPLPPQ